MIGIVDQQNPKRRAAEDAEDAELLVLACSAISASPRLNRFFQTTDFRVLRRLLFFSSRSRYCAMHGVKIGGAYGRGAVHSNRVEITLSKSFERISSLEYISICSFTNHLRSNLRSVWGIAVLLPKVYSSSSLVGK